MSQAGILRPWRRNGNRSWRTLWKGTLLFHAYVRAIEHGKWQMHTVKVISIHTFEESWDCGSPVSSPPSAAAMKKCHDTEKYDTRARDLHALSGCVAWCSCKKLHELLIIVECCERKRSYKEKQRTL